MKLSIITPSIRPDGLKVVFQSLQAQINAPEYEWLPRLSVPGGKSDLCYQMNKALDEATGDIIVFWQDYIHAPTDALAQIVALYQKPGQQTIAYTFPVGKVDKFTDKFPRWDWRPYWREDTHVDHHRWEIDFGAILRADIGALRFDESFDKGFGWENVDFAYRLEHENRIKFAVAHQPAALVYDHDKFMKHPYKSKPNQGLWMTRKAMLDERYGK